LAPQEERYLKDLTNYIFYEEMMDEDSYNKDLIEELFVKKRVKITRHGETETKEQNTTETWTAGRATTGTHENESQDSENPDFESSS
jgi:hypothetical protein